MTASNFDTVAPASYEAWRQCSELVGGGVSSGFRGAMMPHPLFITGAQGAILTDLDGRDYIDYVLGWGPMMLGHSHPGVVGAVTEVVANMQMVGMGNLLEYQAAKAVLNAIPGAQKLLWSNTGTEAVQIALRLARAAAGRAKVVKFVGGYHGWHDTVYGSVSTHTTGERATAQSRGQNPRALEDLIVLRFNDVEATQRTLAAAADLDIAAVLCDPILSSGGLAAPKPEFLQALRAGCDEHGVILIFDEVISGFRIALGGAAEKWGVIPDLHTFGKAIAGGFSQSAVAGKAELIDLVTEGVTHNGTYNGNPVALAAVKAAMEALSEPGIYEPYDDLCERMVHDMHAVLGRHKAPITAHRVGGMLQAWHTNGSWAYWDALCSQMVRRGMVFLPAGKIFLSMAHTQDMIDQTIVAFDESLAALAA